MTHFAVDVLLGGNEPAGWVDGNEPHFRHTAPSMSAPQSRMVIADFLGEVGFKVIEAVNADEALSIQGPS